MDKTIVLDQEIMSKIGFRLENGIWFYIRDERFSVRLSRTCFYVAFFGYETGFQYPPTVGELEKLYFDTTKKRLF